MLPVGACVDTHEIVTAIDASPDTALLSSITTQVEELARQVTSLAERYGTTPDSKIAAELFAAERALNSATRALDRATRLMTDGRSR